jgi:hypothetical protein
MLRNERVLWLSAISAILFFLYGDAWMDKLHNPFWFAGISVWLFAIILFAAIGAVRHAEILAGKLGEPYGTLILTIAVTTIEVTMIANIILSGDNNPGFARDTMFAVVMIVVNGLIGLALLLRASLSRTAVQPARCQFVPGGYHTVGRLRANPARFHNIYSGPELFKLSGRFSCADVAGSLHGVFVDPDKTSSELFFHKR